MAKDDNTQKKLKAFLQRRHPEYTDKLPHWEFMESCYEGGREWFQTNIFRYIKEGDREYKDRIDRAYRFNHTKEVVDLVDKYLFKMDASRAEADAPASVKQFWLKSTLNNLKIKDFMREVSRQSSIYGRIWIVVDNNKAEEIVDSAVASSVADDKAEQVRTYAYVVSPENVLDMSYDDDGCLNWILIHEQVRDDEDPMESSGEMSDRYRLWERHQWTIYNAKKIGGKVAIEVDGPYENSLGVVPVFPADNVISNDLYCSTALIDDIAYLDKAVSNYLSNLDAIIQDQTFSQLAIPAQGIMPGEDAHGKLVEMGTKRIFTYNGEAGGAPFFLSPDVKQSELILKVVNKIINEIYHTVGLAGERTKEDNAMGIDNSSGVAKAYDFERVNSLLTTKAASLEVVENKLAFFVAMWNGEQGSIKADTSLDEEKLIDYPDSFDVRGLYDEFDISARLALVEAPDGMRRKQMGSVMDKLFPKLGKEEKAKMVSELTSWPPKIDPLTGLPPGAAGPASIQKAGNNSLANKLVKA